MCSTTQPAQVKEFISMLAPYTVVAVVDGKVGFVGINYASPEQLREQLQLVDGQGNKYQALQPHEIGRDANMFLAMMKPILRNMIGEIGENLHFILFPKQGNDQQLVMNAKQEGSFAIHLNENIFKWHLPLASLLQPKICPVDGEQMSGAWEYCPRHGTRLEQSREESVLSQK